MLKWFIKSKYNSEWSGYNCELEYISNNDNQTKDTSIWLKLLTGVIIGFVNGFWGGGGGMICVPLLQNIIRLPEKKSHATTLLIMLPLSISSLIVYLISGNLPLLKAVQIGIGFVIGGLIGASILKKISNKWLGYVFSIIIIIGGLKMLI
jgi:uncharacterized membrane protein YfcA